jgi:hypothetical protein
MRWLGEFYLHSVFRACEDDGCIADIKGRSRSVQYHFYSAALLARQAIMTNNQKCKRIALAAANYGINFIDPDGNCNFKGRGQQQIFGYAVAIYLFVACAYLDPSRSDYWLSHGGRILEYLSKWQRTDGSFPLVLNEFEDKMHVGWYDYHHLSVYNAFMGSWLALAAYTLATSKQEIEDVSRFFDNPSLSQIKPILPFEASGVLVARSPDYYICVSRGEDYYETDCGFVPHHIWLRECGPIISCPGGSDPHRYGKLYRYDDMDWNFFAPLPLNNSGQPVSPAYKKQGKFLVMEDDSVIQEARYGGLQVKREWNFREKVFSITDVITSTEAKLSQIVPVCLPLISESVQILSSAPEEWQIIILENESLPIRIDVIADKPLDLYVKEDATLTPGKAFVVRSVAYDPSDTPQKIRYEWRIKN